MFRENPRIPAPAFVPRREDLVQALPVLFAVGSLQMYL